MTDLNEIPAFLDRRKLVYTFTILSSYRNCSHAMYRRYLKKDISYVETPEMKWGNDCHSAFEHRLGSKVPLPVNMQQWESFAAPFDGRNVAVEQKLGITSKGQMTGYWDNDCWFRSKVDVTIRNGATAFINDWKTGGSKYEDSFELEVGALLLKAKYPELTIVKGHYTWLKENRVGQPYDLSDFAATWREMNCLIAKIEADRVSGEFEKHRSGLCSWCDVRDCEHNSKKS